VAANREGWESDIKESYAVKTRYTSNVFGDRPFRGYRTTTSASTACNYSLATVCGYVRNSQIEEQ